MEMNTGVPNLWHPGWLLLQVPDGDPGGQDVFQTNAKLLRGFKDGFALNQDLGPVIDIDDRAFQQPNLMAVVDGLEGRDAEAMLTQRVADMLCKHLIAPFE